MSFVDVDIFNSNPMNFEDCEAKYAAVVLLFWYHKSKLICKTFLIISDHEGLSLTLALTAMVF